VVIKEGNNRIKELNDLKKEGNNRIKELSDLKKELNSLVIELDYLKIEWDCLKKKLDGGRIEKSKSTKNEYIICDKYESCIAGLINENQKINVISNPLGILEYLNAIIENIKNNDCSIDDFTDKTIEEIKEFAPTINKYVYKTKKTEKSDGDIYVMRVFSKWDQKYTYTEKKGIFHSNVLEKYHIFEVLTEFIERTYNIDYLLFDSRPGYEYYMQYPLLNCTDGIFICMDFNKKIEDKSLDIGKLFADKNKSIRLVLTKDPKLYKKTYDYSKKNIELRINTINKTCINLGMNDTSSTMTIIPYYFEAVIDYYLISKVANETSPLAKELTEAYEKYEHVANEMIALNPKDILTRINNAVKIANLDEMKLEFNRLISNSSYKNDYNLYLEYGKQLQKVGQYSDACDELINAYELQQSSDIAYLIGDLFFQIAMEKRSEQKNGTTVDVKNNFDSAIKYFKEAEELDYGKKSLLFSNLGLLYFEYYITFPEYIKCGKYLDNAIDYYKKTTDAGLHDPDNYYKMGEISTEKAEIISEKFSKKCELLNDANKYFEQTVLRRSSETKARMQWAQNLYDMASITGDNNKKPQYLDKAWELLDELIQEDNEYVEAYYLLGLVQAQLAIYEKRDTRRNLLVRACDNLNKILTHKKEYKKAHFYLGAILFIIKEEMEEEEIEEKSLYFRDAFYHFEWTVSLHYDLSDFYFTSGEIDTFSTDTYQFVRTLEKIYEFNTPSLFKQWIFNKEINPNEQFNAIIKKAIKRKKSAISEVE